ncbi:SRPBCC family protein [Alloacidobacterium sp.]|uniref:SRPBCC family protein n=1 Tax=Alloacidobacterium sp. TaxID=2951999 RepID=UPI002D53B859|nr:SRPBCC family protein [Alloacidobacterium sp.]HYK34884.1 SRPBCC family protein [Alloacidobacterium sp.]
MILRILVGVMVVVAAVLIFAATKPPTFQVEKSVTIQDPPERVYPLIADFHNWPQWAPQDREDATMQRTYSGAATGLGAVSDWTSRGSAGAGRMTITAATAPTRVQVVVDWRKPFELRNTHEFTLVPVGAGTQVTWRAEGTNLYMMKVLEVFVGVNGLMGKHFETGLGNLKKFAQQ